MINTETKEFQEWERRPFISNSEALTISEADVLRLLPNGAYNRAEYLKAWEQAKQDKGVSA